MPRRFPPRPSRDTVLGLVVLFAAVLLRLPHLGWGLPDIEEEALPMKKALEMWGWETGGLRLDPQTAGWPSLSFYVHLLLQHLHFGVGLLLGWFENRYDYYVAYLMDPTRLTLLSRFVSVLASAGVVAVGFSLGRRLAGRFAGLAVALLLLASPMLTEHAQLVTPDILLTLFSALALSRIVDIHQRGRPRDYVWAGIWLGLGVASKYTPVILTLGLYLVHLMRRREESKSLKGLGLDDRRLGYAALACVLAFCATSPYTFADLSVLQRDVAYQSLHMSRGHFGHESRELGVFYYVGKVLWPGLGATGLVLGTLGLVAAALRRRGVWLAVLLCVLPYYAALSLLQTQFARYALPLLLPIALGLAGGWTLLREALLPRGRGVTAGAALLLLAMVLGPAVRGTLAYHGRQAHPGTQQLAKAWILENLPGGEETFFAMEMYSPQLPPDKRATLRVSPVYPLLNERQRTLLLERPYYQFQYIPLYSTRVELSAFYYDLRFYSMYDYVITTGAVRKRYEAQPDLFPRQNRFYRDLDRYARLEKTFAPDRRTRGPEVRVYRIEEAGMRRLVEARGPLEAGFYREWLGRLHAPHFHAFVEGLAQHALAQHRLEEADLYYGALYETCPPEQQVGATERLGYVKLLREDFEAAEKLYREVLAQDRNHPAALGNLGYVCERTGRLSEARRYYEQCVRSGQSGVAVRWARQRLAVLDEQEAQREP